MGTVVGHLCYYLGASGQKLALSFSLFSCPRPILFLARNPGPQISKTPLQNELFGVKPLPSHSLTSPWSNRKILCTLRPWPTLCFKRENLSLASAATIDPMLPSCLSVALGAGITRKRIKVRVRADLGFDIIFLASLMPAKFNINWFAYCYSDCLCLEMQWYRMVECNASSRALFSLGHRTLLTIWIKLKFQQKKDWHFIEAWNCFLFGSDCPFRVITCSH